MSFVIPDAPITRQELVDTICSLYGALYYTGPKNAQAFDAIDLGAIAIERARNDGLVVACEAKDPLPPKIDLPLFNALDI